MWCNLTVPHIVPMHASIVFSLSLSFSLSLFLSLQPCSSVDALALPVPQPVSLNHLYCTAIKDGMMVLGVTERYKKKFITQVFYSTMPGPS